MVLYDVMIPISGMLGFHNFMYTSLLVYSLRTFLCVLSSSVFFGLSLWPRPFVFFKIFGDIFMHLYCFRNVSLKLDKFYFTIHYFSWSS